MKQCGSIIAKKKTQETAEFVMNKFKDSSGPDHGACPTILRACPTPLPCSQST